MTTAHALNIEPNCSYTYLSKNVADLTEIYRHEINVCVVERGISSEIETFVMHLLSSGRAMNVIETINVQSFNTITLLPQHLHLQGYEAFCADITQVIDMFSHLFELEAIGLRLGILDKAMCPRFHVDHVPCRLVCTYGGIGTQWLEDAYVDRNKLGNRSGGLSDELSGLILDPDAVGTIPSYAIGLLKGSRWEGNEQHGAVHRSPHLSAESTRRLLLTLDFA
ncbi:MAG: DUF1826 domain-containing protein [Methylococcales bacterium]|nr:DUF1826 domain-containing protein [Methylococcales bacterium]